MPPQLLQSKTVIVTGASNGIGAATVPQLYIKGANVVLADLELARRAAEAIITSLPDRSRALFVPTDITKWSEVIALFKTTIARFGRVDIVVACAGIMESKPFFELEVNEAGELEEPVDAYKVIDVNLKGTMNTLRLAMHHMSSNAVDPVLGCRGSILLVASTSGYFGGTRVVSYIASKHGVMGLLRASQGPAEKHNIRINAVAPFVTPTHITEGYSKLWGERGLPANTVGDVARAIVDTALDKNIKGDCFMVVGKKTREIEAARAASVPQWVGDDIAEILAEGGKFFAEIGGYPLPKPRS